MIYWKYTKMISLQLILDTKRSFVAKISFMSYSTTSKTYLVFGKRYKIINYFLRKWNIRDQDSRVREDDLVTQYWSIWLHRQFPVNQNGFGIQHGDFWSEYEARSLKYLAKFTFLRTLFPKNVNSVSFAKSSASHVQSYV